MKKSYFRAALVMPAIVFVVYSFSSGNPNALSGSVGDNNQTCAQCHSGGQFNAQATITTNIPESGYELNKKYNITISAGSSTSSKHGFQLVAENSSNSRVGTFSGGSGLAFVQSATRALHSSNSNNVKSWTMEWTSPSEDSGDITFYGVVNATNGNGSTSGDQVVTTKSKVSSAKSLGVSDYFASQFGVYPNPATDFTTLELPSHLNSANVIVYDYIGRQVKTISVNQAVSKIDLQGLTSGMYIMVIKTLEGEVSKTIAIK